jgi:hypothetical protein
MHRLKYSGGYNLPLWLGKDQLICQNLGGGDPPLPRGSYGPAAHDNDIRDSLKTNAWHPIAQNRRSFFICKYIINRTGRLVFLY